MKILKISKFIYILCALSIMGSGRGIAQSNAETKPEQGINFANKEKELQSLLQGNRTIPLWAGISLSIDVAGATMLNVSSWGQYEAALRINLSNKYFPILEFGQGRANHVGETTDLRFTTASPFFRLGLDYNLLRHRLSKNRVFVGFRYGFSTFRYDVTGKDLVDSHWQTSLSFLHFDNPGGAHWGELTFGLESQIWKFVHLGWSVRYRQRLYEAQAPIGRVWYIPGYGRNSDNSTLGATFNIIFDLTHFKKTK